MKTYLDCYPCFLRQALDAARMAGAGEGQQKVVLDRVLDVLRQIEPASTPPQIGDQVHRIVRQEVRNGDPYRVVKEASTRQARVYPPVISKIHPAKTGLSNPPTMLIAAITPNIEPKCPVPK